MNKNGKQNKFIGIILLVAAVVGIYFLFIQPSGGILPQKEGDIVNGYYDEATDQCWLDKDHPPGEYPIGSTVSVSMFQCCLNQVGQQVNCNAPGNVLSTFAILDSEPGRFTLLYGAKVTNTGNVALTKAWIEVPIWVPTSTALTTAFSGMVGSTSAQAGTVAIGNFRTFTSNSISLQDIGGAQGSPITYSTTLETFASATNLVDVSKTNAISLTVEKEAIGFTVNITTSGA